MLLPVGRACIGGRRSWPGTRETIVIPAIWQSLCPVGRFKLIDAKYIDVSVQFHEALSAELQNSASKQHLLRSGGEVGMFEDSLIEQKIKTRRAATTILSFLLQALVVVIIVLIPLMFTQALPLNVHTMTELVAPPPPPPPPPPPAAKTAPTPQAQPKTTPVTEQLTEPVKIPQKIAMIHDLSSAAATSAPPPAGVVGGVPGGVPGGQVGGVLGGVLNGTGSVIPKFAAKRIRVSQGVSQGLLIHKVTPQYPPTAKTARVQGSVVLQAEIGKDGKVKNLQVVKGQPLLTAAAVDAVKQWRYKPYFLNGQAVDVDTTITVDFKLGS